MGLDFGGDIGGAFRQIANVSHAGHDYLVRAEIPANFSCLGRGFDDDQFLGCFACHHEVPTKVKNQKQKTINGPKVTLNGAGRIRNSKGSDRSPWESGPRLRAKSLRKCVGNDSKRSRFLPDQSCPAPAASLVRSVDKATMRPTVREFQ